MTGLSTLTVELDDTSAGDTWPYDITGYVSIRDGWDMRRGRNDNQSAIEVATAHLSLNNNDGRFTLGSASYGGIDVDRRIRITETVGGTVYRRFVGYVQNWPTEWPSPHGNIARARITASDRQSRLNRRKLRSISEHEIQLDSPYAFYQLAEASGATSAGDTSGNGRPVLTLAGAGTAPTFGSTSPNSWDTVTSCAFVAGKYLSLDNWPSGGPALPAATVECVLTKAITPVAVEAAWGWIGVAVILQVETSGSVTALLGGTSPVTSAASVCDGVAHHMTVTISTVAGTTTIELFVDGVSQGTTSVSLGTVSGPALTVGNRLTGAGLTGNLANIAVFGSVLSSARILVHANAIRNGFNTERADQRIARLASYAGITTGDQNLETGQQASIAAQSTVGKTVLDAMSDVVQAEGGVLFIAGDGKLTLHNKSHRPLKATGAAALAVTGSDLDYKRPPKFAGDKNYLFNTATGTRNGGAQQRSEDATSRGKFDEYPLDLSTALLPTDELLLNILTWVTAKYSAVGHRISELTLQLNTLPQATVKAALAIELGDRITVASLPTQSPIATADLIVEGIKEDQKVDDWSLTFNTVPSPVYQAWILGDATYGQLGVTTRLYF